MGLADIGVRVEHVRVGRGDVHVATYHRVLRPAADHLSQRGQPGELVVVVLGIWLAAVRHVYGVDSNTAAGRGHRTRLRMWEARPAGDPEDDFLETDPGEDRHPVPLRLAMEGNGIATAGELCAEQLVECIVDELRLLQTDDVRLALLEPGQQPQHSLLDRVHVPGRYPHRAYGSVSQLWIEGRPLSSHNG